MKITLPSNQNMIGNRDLSGSEIYALKYSDSLTRQLVCREDMDW